MSLSTTLMALGLPAELANRVGYQDRVPLDGAGTAQVSATEIIAANTNVALGTSVGDTAFMLPADAEFFQPYFALNTTAEAALVYPPVGDTIDDNALNAAVEIDTDLARVFMRVEEGRWSSFSAGDSGGGSVASIVAGTGISVNSTDPANPVVSNTGVLSVSAGTGITLGGTAQAPSIANAGVLSVTAGTNITVTGTAANPVINGNAGTITAVSVATANGLAGSSSGGATPQLTLSTTVNAPILAGNGTAIGAATTTGSGSTAVLQASPTLTGTPIAPTAAVDTNTTQIATTAMVLGQAASATPLGNAATAVVGTSNRYARADHVHPGREVLTANRTYYVGFNIPTPTISIATPAVVTSTAHGLTAGTAVVFNVPQNTTAASSITAANPAVITMTNTLAAGRPVTFRSTGSLPIPLVQGTTYYVIATGLSGSAFQVSATVGGAAINTTAPTATFTNGSANIGITNANTYLAVGNTVRFATTGGLPTNFATGTDYYVLTASGTQITVSATNGGSAITAGSAGTGTQTVLQSGTHYVSTAGALPTGITEGTTYYVISAGLTTNAFEVSTTVGGSAVNTSGSVTGSPVYGAYAGSDSNTGLSNTSAAAFITIQKAIDVCATIDSSGYTVTVQIADGTYTAATTLANVVGVASAGKCIVKGNTTTPANALVSTTAANCFSADGLYTPWDVKDLKMQTTTSGDCLNASAGSVIRYGNVNFGASGGSHASAIQRGTIQGLSNYVISGSAVTHVSAAYLSYLNINGLTATILGTPAFSFSFAQGSLNSLLSSAVNTFTGSATGSRFYVAQGATIFANGGGANYFPGNSAGTGTNYGSSPYGLYA